MSTIVYPLGTPSDWRGIHGKPYITVSSKGLSNGLSDIPNDGADFGPDTMLGATSPNQYGPPYTQTSGIYEAWNYAKSQAYLIPSTSDNPNSLDIPEIRLLEGQFIIKEKVVISGNGTQINSFKLSGSGGVSTDIICDVPNDYAIEIDPATTQNTGVVFEGFSYDFLSGTSCLGFVNWNFTSAPSGSPWIIWHDANSGTPSGGTYSSFLGSNTAGVTGLFGAYIDGNMASSNPIYVSAYNVYLTGASFGLGIDTGNSVFAYLVNPRSVQLGNTIQGAKIINPFGTVTLGTSSSSYISGNISIEGGFDTGVVMNTNIGGTLEIKNWYFTINSVTLLTSNGYAANVLKIDGVRASGPSGVPLTDGKLYTSYQDIEIKNLVIPSFFTNIPSNNVTTPAVPASGSANTVTNTNSYPVEVNINGGTITGIYKNGTQIYSNSTGLTGGFFPVRLNPNDTIALTYTAVPTWVWLPA